MAAIAKFVSYDGGIAFSDSVVKFQKRTEESNLFPIGDVVSITVKRPQQESDGFIRLVLSDRRMYRLFFREDQAVQALQFKQQYDAFCAGAVPAQAPAPARHRPAAPPKSPSRPRSAERYAQAEEPGPQPEPEQKSGAGTKVLAVIIAILLVIVAALGVMLFLKNRNAAPAENIAPPPAIENVVSPSQPSDGGPQRA